MTNTRYILASSFAALTLIGASAAVSFAQTAPTDAAIDAAQITYPIADLGSCTDRNDCKKYCDKPANMVACIAYAEKQGILKGDDLRVSKIVAQKIADKQTPGGCTTKDQCESYCNGNVAHLNECLSFGEELGVISKTDLAEAKKIASALEKGAKMPGSCTTKGECEDYCAAGSHIDECLSFAEAAGILAPEELDEARKVAPFLKSGETPGKCQSKDECENYCKDSAHFEECLNFAEKAGFVSAEDAAMARKTGGKGPGGCQGKDECEAYCNDEANAASCVAFAKEKGLLSKEEEELVDNGIDRMNAGLAQLPDEARGEVMSCLEGQIGKDKFARIMAKQDMPTKDIGDKIQKCFGNVEEIMKKVMTEKYQRGGEGGAPGVQGGEGARGAPSPEDIMKSIPANVPAEMRGRIEQEIQSRMQGAGTSQEGERDGEGDDDTRMGPPAGAPTGGPVPAPSPKLQLKSLPRGAGTQA